MFKSKPLNDTNLILKYRKVCLSRLSKVNKNNQSHTDFRKNRTTQYKVYRCEYLRVKIWLNWVTVAELFGIGGGI